MKKLTSLLVVTLFLVVAAPSFAGVPTAQPPAAGSGTGVSAQPPASQVPPTSTKPGGKKICVGAICFSMPPVFGGGK